MPRIRLLAVFAALLLAPALARADWTPNGVRLCGASGLQRDPVAAFDGHGAVVAWEDQRAGTGLADIYATRVWPTGFVASGWPTDGVLVCGATGAQQNPQVVGDGAGGAYVAWEDARNGAGNLDVYLQRLTAEGKVADGWPANGLAVVTAAGSQSSPLLRGDGGTGLYVAWLDERAGSGLGDLYATRVLAGGSFAPGWAADGNAVCTAAGLQILPALAADGLGGAVLAWVDRRSGTEYDVYAQRLLPGGAMAWTTDGVAVCTATGDQTTPVVVTAGAGGAYVAWNDFRTGEGDQYAQRLEASGAPAAGWAVNGRSLCMADGAQSALQANADGFGGLLAVWVDYRAADAIYGTRVNADGSLPAGWAVDGNAICAAPGAQLTPMVVPDGLGGAYVAWEDQRSVTLGSDIWAMHLNADASAATGWAVDGNAIGSAASFQFAPSLAIDGFGGAYVTWQDRRNNAHYDVYAARVGPALAPVAGAPIPPERASLAVLGANPFRDHVTLRLATPRAGVVRVQVLDAAGRAVRTLVDGTWPAGRRELAWDGRDDGARALRPGLYFVRATGPGLDARVKLVRVE